MYQERWYQEQAEEALYHFFTNNKWGDPIVAMPTGTGKSVVIAKFIANIFRRWSNQRIMMLTHVEELIAQNAERLLQIWPNAPLGIFSAGLGQKDSFMPITFGGVKSVINALDSFGKIDLLIIDECHLVSPNGATMYRKVIDVLRIRNPKMRVIGFSATMFRSGQGLLIQGNERLFTHIAYDLTSRDCWQRLIAEGHLVPPVPKRTSFEIDTSNMGMSNGDYNLVQLEKEVNKDEITYRALQEICEYGHDRYSWLIFASGVAHAEAVNNMLALFGVSCTVVHTKVGKTERRNRIADWKQGKYRAIINNNMLTTGVDNPACDLIGMLRPTTSSVLWVQMLGRGTRPYDYRNPKQYIPGFEFIKKNCLVLDFAGNTRRLGPINDPLIPRPPKSTGAPGVAPVRLCEACDNYSHARAPVCEFCGEAFTYKTKIVDTASAEELITTDMPQVDYFDVQRVIYNRHDKEGSPPSIRVTYVCGLRGFSEFIGLEHGGLMAKKARDWWRQRHTSEPPATTAEALTLLSELREPARIRVWTNKKYPEVLGYEY